ncbi:MAG: major capsid protein [Microvirus sp.]|nr:MAG: major capsid protein [Microvirus sp.]
MLGSRSSQHNFAMRPNVNMARSQFDRSYAVKDTFDFDFLVPFMVDEILPGDTANVNLHTFARLATQKVPIMDNLYIDYFFFFVPNRLIWTNWEKFMGAQDNPGDSTSFIIPSLAAFGANQPAVDTIYDKMGLPCLVPNAWTLKNALPLRAYNLIWNEWFRDQNIQNSVPVKKDNGPDPLTDYTILRRGKRHDYFTSALPFLQKGTAITLPLGTQAPVRGLYGSTAVSVAITGVQSLGTAAPGTTSLSAASVFAAASKSAVGTAAATAFNDTNLNVYADLSVATAATINQLRQAMQIQGLLELDARGGTRYVELLQAHFNVTSPDFRLQRSEYLGGGSTKINMHPTAQTSPTSGGNALAQLGSFATSSTQGSAVGFTKSFVEHGYVIGLAAARADITYQQGINKLWDRSTKYDFFWPKLQELGEQAILNKEIYLRGLAADELVFGYQERYAEYRFKPSEIHGRFRSNFATPLDQWHMAENFGSLPALNSTFIQSTTPILRALSITTEPHIIWDGYIQYKHARPMVSYSVPVTLGRF